MNFELKPQQGRKTARHKLNKIAIGGSLAMGGLPGLLTQSSVVFIVSLGVMLWCSLQDGSLRL
jgi:hypothetical protein